MYLINNTIKQKFICKRKKKYKFNHIWYHLENNLRSERVMNQREIVAKWRDMTVHARDTWIAKEILEGHVTHSVELWSGRHSDDMSRGTIRE